MLLEIKTWFVEVFVMGSEVLGLLCAHRKMPKAAGAQLSTPPFPPSLKVGLLTGHPLLDSS